MVYCIIPVTANSPFFLIFQKNAMTDLGEKLMEQEILDANKQRAKDSTKRSLIFDDDSDDDNDAVPLKKSSLLSMASTQRLSESVSYFICLWSIKYYSNILGLLFNILINIFHRILIHILTRTILTHHLIVMQILIILALTSERYVLAPL